MASIETTNSVLGWDCSYYYLIGMWGSHESITYVGREVIYLTLVSTINYKSNFSDKFYRQSTTRKFRPNRADLDLDLRLAP